MRKRGAEELGPSANEAPAKRPRNAASASARPSLPFAPPAAFPALRLPSGFPLHFDASAAASASASCPSAFFGSAAAATAAASASPSTRSGPSASQHALYSAVADSSPDTPSSVSSPPDDVLAVVLTTRHRNPYKQTPFFDVLCTRAATFSDLDDFIRSRWLDYEWPSVFVRSDEWCRWERLPREPGHFCGGSFPLDQRLCGTVREGEEFGYVYAFRHQTELVLTVKEERMEETAAQLQEPVTSLRRSNDGELVEAAQAALRTIANEPGEVDEQWPSLSGALRLNAVLEIGRPLKGNNPLITRESPFYCTIWDGGGELNNGPVLSGPASPTLVGKALDKVEQVTDAHYQLLDRLHGRANEEAAQPEPDYAGTFLERFPLLSTFLTTGKNCVVIGRQYGNYVLAKAGKKVLIASDAVSHLEPCFELLEAVLKHRDAQRKT